MTDGYVAASIVLSLIAFLAYLLFRWLKHKKPQLDSAALVVIETTAIVVGARIVVRAARWWEEFKVEGNDRIYVMLGGLAVIWVAFRGLHAQFRAPPRRRQRKNA